MTTRATVVVVTYNNERDITACLRSLLLAARHTELDVVVVDNASVDGTGAVLDAVAADDPRVRILHNAVNVGFGGACNQGAAAGDGEVVVLLNPDTVTHTGAIDTLVEVALRPGLGPVGGRTLDRDGALDPRSMQGAPTLAQTLGWAAGLPVWGRRLPGRLGDIAGRNGVLLPPSLFDREGPAPVVIGCLLAMRRDDWEALGGFDERYFMYGEDVDLSLRARARGLTPTYTPDAVITHYVGGSSTSLARKLVVALGGRATVMAVHWSPGRARLGQLLLVAGVALRSAASRGEATGAKCSPAELSGAAATRPRTATPRRGAPPPQRRPRPVRAGPL